MKLPLKFFPISLLYVLFTLQQLMSQSSDPLIIQRIRGEIILDGLGNEPDWQLIQPLPMTMYTPLYLGELTERTEIRLGYDNEFIYVSAQLYDSSPAEIQANSLVRDLDRGGDFLNVLIDSYNDNQNMMAFMTTPAGNRLDAEANNDAEGDDFWNLGWNSYWDCAVVQNTEGWFAEMRIPFSSLRFQEKDGRVTFGLIVHRLINRKNERQVFPSIAPKKPFSAWKASQAQKIVLEGITHENPVYLSSYALGGIERHLNPKPLFATYSFDERFSREIGLDMKYSLAKSMTLDLTVNTDFAQIESDAQQINLTRYSLFYPERRQFFQERSALFEVRYAGSNRLFDSRKIGFTPAGEPVRILGGARLVGRAGDWDVGFLDMQTEKKGISPSENFSILRFRRPVINKDSYVGTMLTGRTGNDGSYNVAAGFDSKINIQDADYLSVNLIHVSRNNSNSSDGIKNSVIDLEFDRRTTEGLGGNVTALYVGDQYDPGVGFNLWNGITLAGPLLYYGWFENNSTVVRKHTLDGIAKVWLRNSDRSVQSGVWGVGWLMDLASGASTYLDYFSNYEDLPDTLLLAGKLRVPTGSYTFHTFRGMYSMTPGKLLRADLKTGGGTFYDGTRIFIIVAPTWNISRNLEFGSEYEYNGIRFNGRGESLDAHIVRFRVQGSFNAHLSGTVLSQYNSAARSLGSNVRIRYNFREGADLFIVYNQLMNTEQKRYGFDVPMTENSTVLLKYVNTFSL